MMERQIIFTIIPIFMYIPMSISSLNRILIPMPIIFIPIPISIAIAIPIPIAIPLAANCWLPSAILLAASC